MVVDVKAFLSKNYGDLDYWLSTQIEAKIDTLKNK